MANKKKENPLLDLIINIAIPSFILIKFSGEEYLGPVKGLVIALSFPIVYGLYSLIKEKRTNLFSILGILSTGLTGTFGLLKLSADWIAVKEASIPLLIGIFVIISTKTSYPMVEKIIYNDKILNKNKISEHLQAKNNTFLFNKRLKWITLLVAGSFFLSATLNYYLAKVMLTAEPGSVIFNEQLGKMQALSFPVIALPSTIILFIALFLLINSIKKLSGLTLKEILNSEDK